MSDYDAAFAAATGASTASPYDEIMKGIMPAAPLRPKDVPANAPAAIKAGASLNDLGRQLGLTARYGLEGVAQGLQIATEPIRYLQDMVTPERTPTLSGLITGQRPPKSKPLGAIASEVADFLRLPKPEDANERTVAEAARLMAGAGGLGGVARAAQAAPGAVGRAAEFLGANMGQQLAAAAGAGLAANASKEAGGGGAQQFGAGMVGGLVGGMTPAAVGATIGKAAEVARRSLSQLTPQQIDQKITAILQQGTDPLQGVPGVNFGQLSSEVRDALRTQLRSALQAGKEVDPAAVRRYADLLSVGATPTRGMVSLDPVQITREQNLARIGANTGDEGLQGLAGIYNRNNAAFIRNLDDAGATRGDPLAAGQAVSGAITRKDAAWADRVRQGYDSARQMAGGDIPLDRRPFIDNIFGALARENRMAFLPPEIGNMLNQISSGVVKVGGQTHEVPFNANVLDNLKTMLATAQRGTADGNVKAALSIARQALDSTPLQPLDGAVRAGGNQLVTQAQAAARGQQPDADTFMGALNAARAEAAKRFGWQESSKVVDSVLGGMEPDKLVQRFVVGGTLADARAIVAEGGRGAMRDAIMAHLKDKALNGATSEVGKFSQSAYNKALSQLGDPKLSLFFDAGELAQLRALGRAASYAQVQPVGSAVNNSNSGAVVAGQGLDLMRLLATRAPIIGPLAGRPLANGFRELQINLQTNAAQNVQPGLLARHLPAERRPAGQGLLLPGLALSGGLLAPLP